MGEFHLTHHIVQLHHNVGTNNVLQLNRLLRRQQQIFAIKWGPKVDALLRYIGICEQRHHLEAPAVLPVQHNVIREYHINTSNSMHSHFNTEENNESFYHLADKCCWNTILTGLTIVSMKLLLLLVVMILIEIHFYNFIMANYNTEVIRSIESGPSS